MSKPSADKRARREKRKQRKVDGQQHRNAQKERIFRLGSLFPPFSDIRDTRLEEFGREVRKVMDEVIAPGHEGIFGDAAEEYRRARREGFEAVFRDSDCPTALRLLIGQKMFEHLPDRIVKCFPFIVPEFVFGLPGANEFYIAYKSLVEKKTVTGTVYFSDQRPTINVNGNQYIVGYSSHAIERLALRLVGPPLARIGNRMLPSHYAGMKELFLYLNECIYFEPWTEAPDGDIGFVLWSGATRRFVESWFGSEIQVDSNKYFRAGYCIGDIRNDVLVARTLLLPGMKSTPEWQLFDSKSGYRLHVKENASLVPDGDYMKMIKAAHEAGIPQMKTITAPVFRTHVIIPPEWKYHLKSRPAWTERSEIGMTLE